MLNAPPIVAANLFGGPATGLLGIPSLGRNTLFTNIANGLNRGPVETLAM
jgi:hypothetical protein